MGRRGVSAPALCCVVTVLMGCATPGSVAHSGPDVGADAGPFLYDVTPDSVPAGEAYPVVLTIRGEGFDTEGNIVRLGHELADTVDSAADTEIRWAMPKSVQMSDEVPPMVVQPGRYELTVQTRAGVSNPVVVTVLAGG